MLRGLFILMLVTLMAGVGYYYEHNAGRIAAADIDTVVGTAIDDSVVQAAPRSGVDLDALDRNTRPQDDFYQFANGAWLDRTEIPPIYSGYTVYHEVNENAETALRKIVEQAAADPGAPGTESQQAGEAQLIIGQPSYWLKFPWRTGSTIWHSAFSTARPSTWTRPRRPFGSITAIMCSMARSASCRAGNRVSEWSTKRLAKRSASSTSPNTSRRKPRRKCRNW